MTFSRFQNIVCKNKLDYKVPDCKVSAIMAELGGLAKVENDDAIIGAKRNRETKVSIVGRLLWRIVEYTLRENIQIDDVIKTLLKSYEK